MSNEHGLRWTSAARTDPGIVRSRNEDAYLDLPERGLWAVADGMGGHALGDFASRTVIEGLSSLPDPGDLLRFEAGARNRLDGANRQLRIEAALRDVPVIGSTVVALLAHGRDCRYLWAGDSRAYLFRGGYLRQLTRDHSQLEEYKSRGGAESGAVSIAPPRNLITRAVGADDILMLDGGSIVAREGDLFVLCSDGLCNAASAHEIAALLAVTLDCRHAVQELVELALEHGGPDNVSVIVIRADAWHAGDETVVNPAL